MRHFRTWTQRFWLCSVDFRRPIKKMPSFPRPMLPSLLPEKGKYKIHGGVKMKGTVTRDFKVLTEKISLENIAVIAELIAMRETKTLIGFMGYHAEISFARTSSAKTSPDTRYRTVTILFRAWHCSCAFIAGNIWTTSCTYLRKESK